MESLTEIYRAPAEVDVECLADLISRFHQSSLELTEEYRRLQVRVASLDGELEKKNRELEKSLFERERARSYLLSVLESLKAGVLVLDRALEATFVNRRWIELAGDADRDHLASVTGERLLQFLDQGRRDVLPLECERPLRLPDGATIPVHLTISEIAVGDDQPSGYVLVLQDVGRLKRLEAEAARTRRLAALGEMAAEMAHQIKSPLGGIELYASLLKDKENVDAQRVAGEILAAVNRLYTTISHLLSFANEPSIACDLVPVALLVRDVRELSSSVFRSEHWSLAIDMERDLPPLWGDRGLLAQALLNLVTNAKEAMPEGGKVRLTVKRSPRYTMNGRIHRTLEVGVSDDGLGIAAENRERIFDPFFTTKAAGTGLGLALTHKVVRAHHGSIEVVSEPGRGSRFVLLLPVAGSVEDHAEADSRSGR
ncbi:MAG TPA: ATP-binding protein [Verrucomicrobiae bacterium]|jgi:signal transduction histidine kinase|nr:ATP-binding protein [Verrucomicrobiae bacterium]